MKKAFSFLVVAFLTVFLCACNDKTEAEPQLKNIGFIADFSLENGKTSFSCFVDGSGGIKASVLSPSSASDMLFAINSTETAVSYKGSTYAPTGGEFPAENTVRALYEAITDASLKQLSVTDGENCTLKGKIGCGDYVFTFSPSGIPLCLEIPQCGYEIIFKDVCVDKI